MGVVVFTVLAVLGAAIAGCGDDSESDQPEPQIPVAVAEPLAKLSDQAADQLAVGDACGAQQTVDKLEHKVELSQPQVPRELREELEAGVQKLVAKVDCVRLPSVTEETVPVPEPEPEPKPKPKPKPQKEERLEQKVSGNEDCPPGQEKKGEVCIPKSDGGNGENGNGGSGSGGGGSGGTGVGNGGEEGSEQ